VDRDATILSWASPYGGDNAPAHAVTSLSKGNSYTYDANGNQIKRIIGADTYDLKYDAEKRLVEVKKNGTAAASFVFNGDTPSGHMWQAGEERHQRGNHLVYRWAL
jgi:hypothetical protein